MKRALIIGAARSGIAAGRLLRKNGYEVWLTDSKTVNEKGDLEAEGIKVFDNGHPDFLKEQEYDLIVKNPGIKYSVPFVKYFADKGCEMLNEMEVAVELQPQHEYAAITGTNGKTTCTTMLGGMLKTLNPHNEACGNIGLPVCSVIDGHEDEKLQLAIECGAFQLLGIKKFHPAVSVIMNLTVDHVDYFGTVDAYYRSKTLVYKNQDENDYFLRNVDDPLVLEYCQNIPCKVIDFSLVRTDVDLRVENNKVMYLDVELFDLSRFKLPGMHNVQNAMVAACMAYLMGVDVNDIRSYCESFMGVEHRIEFVRELDGVRYYNDSKGTNVDSTIMALKSFNCPIHILVGGYDKKTGFDGLKPYLGNVKTMYAYGVTREQFIPLFDDVRLYDNMFEALDAAHENAKPGEVVLLSPACASWDQFPNFEVRGEQFKEKVNAYEER